MKYILLDTNFLMLPHQFGIDIFGGIEDLIDEKYELVTLSSVVEELKNIQEGEDRVAAQLGLKLIKVEGVEVIESSGGGDKAITEFAKNNNAIVCTNDKKLRKNLQKIGIKTIYMRSKKRLDYR